MAAGVWTRSPPRETEGEVAAAAAAAAVAVAVAVAVENVAAAAALGDEPNLRKSSTLIGDRNAL